MKRLEGAIDLSLCEKISQKSEGVKKLNYMVRGERLLLNDTPPNTMKKNKDLWFIYYIDVCIRTASSHIIRSCNTIEPRYCVQQVAY